MTKFQFCWRISSYHGGHCLVLLTRRWHRQILLCFVLLARSLVGAGMFILLARSLVDAGMFILLARSLVDAVYICQRVYF